MKAEKTSFYKDTLKTIVALSIPTVIEEVLSTLLQYADTAMVGQLGADATASVSVTTTIGWLIGAFVYAAGTGVMTLISRAYGAKDRARAEVLSGLALKLSLVIGLLVGAVCLIISPFLPAWMGAEEGIRQQASIYFAIISVPMVFRSASAILGSAVRATQNTKGPMLVGLVSNIVNIGLDYLLIYPAGLGVTGAALATAIAITLSGILDFILFMRTPFLKAPQLKRHDNAKDALRELTSISIPVALTSVVSCLGYVVFAALVSRMGTLIFAAHSIAVNAETIFYIPGYGLRTATAALVGAAIGERNRRKLLGFCRVSVMLTVGMMVVGGVILFFVAEPLMSLFSPVSSVIELGSRCLRIVAFSEPFFGLMVVLQGIFYGTGKTKWPLITEIVSMWGIRITLTAIGINYLSFDLDMVWYCMIADNITKAVLLSLPFILRPFRKRVLDIL